MSWHVKLSGDAHDLEELPTRFAVGPLRVVRRDDQFYVTGTGFDHLTDPANVVSATNGFLLEATAVISLEWPSMRLPAIVGIERHVDGRIDQYALPNGIRSRTNFGEVKVGEAEDNSPAARTQTALNAADRSPHLRAALRLWGRPDKSWGALYRITEELQAYIGRGLPEAGLCSTKDMSRFTQSAQSHDVAGLDARHRVGYARQPAKPMNLEEAMEFIRGLLRAVVRS